MTAIPKPSADASGIAVRLLISTILATGAGLLSYSVVTNSYIAVVVGAAVGVALNEIISDVQHRRAA